jgi:hypothetical protein
LTRIVYLGGLAPDVPVDRMSPHMRSRVNVGEILRGSGVPTIELRAAVIIGSGSASFEMLRYLTERLPAMVTPRWVRTRTQPIAIRDVLRYLVLAAGLPPEVNRTFEIGGPEVLSYQEMMQAYARVAGLPRRIILPINVLSPGLSSHWVNLVTPVPKSIARPLVQSLRHPAVCHEHDIANWIPDPDEGLVSFDSAVKLALTRIREADVITRWSGAATPGAPSDPLPTDPQWSGGTLYTDVREVDCHARIVQRRELQAATAIQAPQDRDLAATEAALAVVKHRIPGRSGPRREHLIHRGHGRGFPVRNVPVATSATGHRGRRQSPREQPQPPPAANRWRLAYQ